MSAAALTSGELDLPAANAPELLDDLIEDIFSEPEPSSSTGSMSSGQQEVQGDVHGHDTSITSYYGDAFKPGCLIDNRYEILTTIGSGSFATVYECMDLQTERSELVAVKVVYLGKDTDEDGNWPSIQDHPLVYEVRMYKKLGAIADSDEEKLYGVPTIRSFVKRYDVTPAAAPPGSKKQHCCSYLAMQLLGKSVGEMAWEGVYREDVHRLATDGVAMLMALKSIHDKGLVHCDVKTWNFCQPLYNEQGKIYTYNSKLSLIYVVDLGFTYDLHEILGNSNDVEGIDDEGFFGTPDYASVRSLRGHFRTARDDIEGLACCLVEMALGKLPWKLTNSKECAEGWSEERLQEMATQKEQLWEKYIQEGVIPASIGNFYHYISKLGPKDPINYKKLRSYLYQAVSCADVMTEDDFETCGSQQSIQRKHRDGKSSHEVQPACDKKRNRQEKNVQDTESCQTKKARVDSDLVVAIVVPESQPEE